MASPELLVASRVGLGVDALGLPLAHDRQGAVVRRNDSVAHRRAVSVDQIQALAVGRKAHSRHLAGRDPGRRHDFANRGADRAPHRRHVPLAPADVIDDRQIRLRGDSLFAPAFIIQSALDDRAADVDSKKVRHMNQRPRFSQLVTQANSCASSNPIAEWWVWMGRSVARSQQCIPEWSRTGRDKTAAEPAQRGANPSPPRGAEDLRAENPQRVGQPGRRRKSLAAATLQLRSQASNYSSAVPRK
jgi:hypothetical protein